MKVLVIGGGIGGLALARALRRAHIRAHVFEKTSEYRPSGAAITIWPNGMKGLERLGVARFVQVKGWPIIASDIRLPNGKVIASTPVDRISRDAGRPTIAVRRSDVQSALLGSPSSLEVAMNKRCTDVQQDATGVWASFEDATTARGDLLVGADGLWSRVREILAGAAPPRHLGYCLWRGIAALDDCSLRDGRAFETWSTGVRFGMAQINEREVYWYAGLNNCPDGDFASVRPLLGRTFAGWHRPIPDVLDATRPEDAMRTEIYDRPPLVRWRRRRVALLGDAAHPMTPDLGQGACTAIEDAVALASCLSHSARLQDALAWYESLRRERCNEVSARSRRISRVSQWNNRALCCARDLVTRLTPSSLLARALARTVHGAA